MNMYKLLLTSLFTVFLLGCGEAYRREAGIYFAAAESVLIEQGLCSSNNDCSQKGLVFWEGGNSVLPSTKKAFISIYGIKGPAVADRVAQRIAQEKARIHGPACLLQVYPGPHGEAKGKAKEISI